MDMFTISAGSPRWPFTPVRKPCRAPEWKGVLNMNVAEMNKFENADLENAHLENADLENADLRYAALVFSLFKMYTFHENSLHIALVSPTVFG